MALKSFNHGANLLRNARVLGERDDAVANLLSACLNRGLPLSFRF